MNAQLSPGLTNTSMVDPFGRTVSYLRVSVTDRCDFRCVYCMSEHMTFSAKEGPPDARGARSAVQRIRGERREEVPDHWRRAACAQEYPLAV